MTRKLPQHPVEATLHPGNLNWTLHMHRSFRQGQDAVWDAITKADLVARWMPFRPAHDLIATGDVWLTPPDGDGEDMRCNVVDVSAPTSLRYLWVADELRFEVTPDGNGTMLDVAHTFNDRYSAAQYAADWHLRLGALELLLVGEEILSVIGQNAVSHDRADLEREYEALFTDNDSTPATPMDEL